MMKFYKIAGLNVEMDTFGRTQNQAKKYEIIKPDKIDISINQNYDFIKKYLPKINKNDLEYVATEREFYNALIDFNGFRLHGSTVVVDDKAYIFSADSGTGKSTHTRLWLKKFGDEAYILNDDKPALKKENGIWYAYGTPWCGKEDINIDKRVELAGIAIIERSETNSIIPYNGILAFKDIFSQVNRPFIKEKRDKIISMIDDVMNLVPIWKLCCNMNDDAADIAYEVMSKGKEIK